MTHNELLAKLTPTDTPFPRYSPNSVVNALVAVVKLHSICCDLEELCNECNPNVPYPCPTIQAIEKELG
jgi:hypothetical protein